MTFGRDSQEEKTRKGPWTLDEDMLLTRSVAMFGEGRWDYIAQSSGLKRSGKSRRMRRMNYLRPDLKHGPITSEEEHKILLLHASWGNKWSRIARRLLGRTDNEIKNYWRSHIRKKTNADNMQMKSAAASSRPSENKEDIQDGQTSTFEDYRPIDDDNQQASEKTLDDYVPPRLQINNDPFAPSPYDARFSEWASGLINSHHHGFNSLDSTEFSYPPLSTLNSDCDIIWEYHFGSL